MTEGVRGDIARLRSEHAADHEPRPAVWRDDTPATEVESVVAYAEWLMERDRKSTGLKSLQGRIWEAGYRSGELRGEVYPDVPPALARWTGLGKTIAIFSSGSVLAQKLLFAHTTAGDLTRFIHAYFDTTTGAKNNAGSYEWIASQLGRAAAEILFLSDVGAELDAARLAGMQTALCARSDRPRSTHPVLHSFDDVSVS